MRPLSTALTFVALLLASGAASAASPVGQWSSSSGATVVIPFDQDPLVVVITAANGQKSLYGGRWVPGLEGTQFTYNVGYGDKRTATFDSRDPRNILVRGGHGTTDAVWTRAAKRLPVTSVSGTWRSTSGNRFTVLPPTHDTQAFDVVLTRPNGQMVLYPARWVPGLEGTQFTYQADYTTHTATIDARSLATIRVSSTGTPTTWTREGRAPRHDVVFGDVAAPGLDDLDVTIAGRGGRGGRDALVCRPGRAARGDLEIRLGLLVFACELDLRTSGR